MLSQPRPAANNNPSTTPDRQTDAVDLNKAALTATVGRRDFLKALTGVLVCSTAAGADPTPDPKVAPPPYTINGMPHSPRFYGLQGQDIKPTPYRGELCEGGALNLITTAVNNIKEQNQTLPLGTIYTLYIYTKDNDKPSVTVVLPNVPRGVSRDTMKEFLISPGGKAAISILARMQVDIPFINGRPGNVEFTDPKLGRVIIGIELPAKK